MMGFSSAAKWRLVLPSGYLGSMLKWGVLLSFTPETIQANKSWDTAQLQTSSLYNACLLISLVGRLACC